MNLKCLICSDLFTPHAEIHTTPCGHLFHYHCLAQWIERSRTCPQCRSKATASSIHKIYLSVEENAETLDCGTLQNKLDNLQFQMNLREKDIKNLNDKYHVAKKQTIGLREEIKSQENKSRVLESAMHALKEQITYFKSKAKECDRLEDEIKRLKDRLRDMEHVQTVLTGSREQVDDMLRHNRDPHSLTILVSTLKKELIDSDKRKKQMQARLKESQNEAQNYKVELTQLNKHCNKLQHDVELHKHCESERQYLKKKIDELTKIPETNSPTPLPQLNSSIRRIVAESPAPFPKLIQLKNEARKKDISPSLPEKIQAIKDSDSPYLPVQSSGIGYSGLVKYGNTFQPRPSSSTTTGVKNKFSIFKQPSSLKIENIKKPSMQQISYDGLGGHAKHEEFPSPQPNKIAIKRPRSSSTITSAKFRKLAPQKKLNDFFNDSPQSDCAD